MKHTPISILALALLLEAPAFAQVGDDGEITTRSDIKMSVDGALGTGGQRLDALAGRLEVPLAEMKRCYAKLVQRDPGVRGMLYVNFELRERGSMRVVPEGANNLSGKMRHCVQGAFHKLSARDIPRPTKARIALELWNSAADSVPAVRAKEAEAAQVDVRADSQGRSFSEGRSLDGEVEFRVTASGANAPDVVERVHTGVRSSLARLFDCRRRSGQLGSPEGELSLDVFLGGKSQPKVEVRSNTVNSDRAPPCVDRAMTRGLAGLGWGKATVELRFAPEKAIRENL